ncbi:MAG TPA: response regulator [Bryobacteraceae bacterium]|nr:response regulator [Bryobacteraceae bacterium]
MLLKSRPILAVEDSDQDFDVLEMCLKTAGVLNPVQRCASGEEIRNYFERMERAAASEIPVFVFLDLNLPGIRGADVLARLKRHKTLNPVPVVVLTTSSQVRDVDLSYSLGAAGFLTKPLDLDKFEKMIQHVADYWFSCVKLPENAERAR